LIHLTIDQKTLVGELKTEWKKLWAERVDDKIRAEGIAKNDYSRIYVDRGTIIHATRDYKALNFKAILEQYEVENAERYLSPSSTVGGWNKFIKSHITKQTQGRKKRADLYRQEKTEKQQPKKGGRGWLHK
jgi:ABC-type sulfate transport system substrate-binding protein